VNLAVLIAEQGLSRLKLKRRISELEREIANQRGAQDSLEEARNEFEHRVERLTNELTETNEQRQKEIAERLNVKEALRKSEKNLAAAQKIARIGHWTLDPETGEVNGSDELFRILSLTREDATRDAFVEAVHPGDREYYLRHIRRGMEHGDSWDIEHRLIHKDGTQKWIHARGEAVLDGTGKTVQLRGTAQDITDRKMTELELKESERRLKLLASNTLDASWIMDLDLRFTYVSQSVAGMMGYSAGDWVGTSLQDHCDEEDFQRMAHRVSVEISKGPASTGTVFEAVLLKKNREPIHVEVHGKVVFDEEDHPVALQGITRDITERKRFEEELRQSERRYRTLFERARDSIMIIDAEGENSGRIVDANRVAAELHGYELAELLSLRIHDLDTPESAERIPERTERILKGEWLREETTHTRKDGSVFPIEISASVVDLEDHQYALAIDRDITERKENEEALRESEERFRALSDATFEAIFLSEKGVCIGQNLAAEKMFGFSAEEALGRNVTEWIAPASRGSDLDHILLSDEGPYEAIAIRKDGTTFPCQIQGKMIHHGGRSIKVTALRDNTDRKKAAELLVQVERRRAISDLTSGVTHNFRNWLQVIVGATRLALQDVERQEYDEIKVALEKTMKAAQSGAGTLRRLEQFAQIREGASDNEDTIFDVSRTLQNAVEMTKPWWKTGPEEDGITICLKSNLTRGAWVRGREVEMFEIFVNLIGNASEAITEDGEIEVETLIEADKVIVRIGDTGTGIAPQNLSKIFEPFWTTKALVGTGLGLPTSLSIAKRHNGSIHAESRVGSGSIFTVTLPRAHPPGETDEDGRSGNPKTGLRVLVIDDMESSVELLQIQLTRHGHDVVAALSGKEGLKCLSDSEFDLVISDLVMPEMSGWEVGYAVKQICEERGVSKPPFILLTGIGEELLEESRIAESGVDAVTEKPLDTKELIDIISKCCPTHSHP
jgi:PAS domain S-box-containing protein